MRTRVVLWQLCDTCLLSPRLPFCKQTRQQMKEAIKTLKMYIFQFFKIV